MRKSCVFAVIAWAAVPLATPTMGIATVAATTVLLRGSAATAGTAILPGWRHSCGRDPRCFERGEARRRARLNALYMRYQGLPLRGPS
jgi:hypothetical protein